MMKNNLLKIFQIFPVFFRNHAPAPPIEPIIAVTPEPPVLRKAHLIKRARRSIEIRTSAIAFINGSTKAEPCKIINVSDNGLQIKLDQSHCQELLGKQILVAFEYEKEWTTCQATIKWLESQKRLGCMVSYKSHSWKKFVGRVWVQTDLESNKVA